MDRIKEMTVYYEEQVNKSFRQGQIKKRQTRIEV